MQQPIRIHNGKLQISIADLLQTGYPVEIILPDRNRLLYNPPDDIPAYLTTEHVQAIMTDFLDYLETLSIRK